MTHKFTDTVFICHPDPQPCPLPNEELGKTTKVSPFLEKKSRKSIKTKQIKEAYRSVDLWP